MTIDHCNIQLQHAACAAENGQPSLVNGQAENLLTITNLMLVLAIDTATDWAGLALYQKEKLWAEEVWDATRNHSATLSPRLERLLAEAKLSVADLGGIAVAIGPGSYTGVRVGVSLTKGLALPHRLPVVGIPTLEIAAYPHRFQPLPVVAVAQAGRKRLLVAHYAWVEQTWTETQAPQLSTVETLAADLRQDVLIAGELSPEQRDYLQGQVTAASSMMSPVLGIRRPGCLAELGEIQLSQPSQFGLDQLVPFYMREP